MKKILLLVLFLFVAGCQNTTTPKTNNINIDFSKSGPAAKKHKITFQQVEKEVNSGEAIFLDVRTEKEFKDKNFGITTNFPIELLESGKLPKYSKDTKIYIHCLLGIRSADATEILRKAGYTNVYDLGGLEHVKEIGGVLK